MHVDTHLVRHHHILCRVVLYISHSIIKLDRFPYIILYTDSLPFDEGMFIDKKRNVECHVISHAWIVMAA